MRKIIITEEQYSKVKKTLIERAINETLLNENDEISYTVQSPEVHFETGIGTYPELKIFKGAKFIANFKGKLYANTKFQFVRSDDGEVVKAFDSNDEPYDDENKFYTFKGNVYYNCSTYKFTVPDKSTREYYAEEAAAVGLQKELVKLCKRATEQGKPKTSYGAESVGGGKSYTQQNDYIVMSDGGKTLKIPKGTGYAYKEGKQGASFKLPGNKFGWFGCPNKTFLVDNVKYKDTKGALANNIVKSICGTSTVEPQKEPKTQQYRSSEPRQVAATPNPVITDFQNYI